MLHSILNRKSILRRKYELQQFLNSDVQMIFPFPPSSSSHCNSLSLSCTLALDKRNYEKQSTGHRIHGIGNAFRNSWRRKESEHRSTKKSNSMVIIYYSIRNEIFCTYFNKTRVDYSFYVSILLFNLHVMQIDKELLL